jgi:4-hydroxy-tetrahydrodipicolinate synthase
LSKKTTLQISMSDNYHFLAGTGVALIAPFKNDYTIDYKAFKKLLQHVSPHVDYLVVYGTTAETPTLSYEEGNELLQFVIENNTHKRPIVYGIGSNATQEALGVIEKTDFTHVDAVLSVCPYYNKPTQAGIMAHYKTLADRLPVPLILYNVPSRTAVNMTAETTLILSKHPNIIGIKEASGHLEQVIQIAAQKDKDFLIISGDDAVTVPIISVGGVGVISVLANAFPDRVAAMVRLALEGDYESASQQLFEILPVIKLAFEEGNPVGIKAILSEIGIGNDLVRLPLVPASDSLKEKIKKEVNTKFRKV